MAGLFAASVVTAVAGLGFALAGFMDYRRGEHGLGGIMVLGAVPILCATCYLLSLM